ncbi:MAG: CPBP family intramembrane metalloprotease [Planctomycetes bacterium]|nr:CPBP family intramembrane metalloprotease [Planctomycetota bacterium]
MPESDVMTIMVLALIHLLAIGSLSLLIYTSVLSPRGIDRAPERPGKLTLVDPIIAFGFLVLGTSAAALFARSMHIDIDQWMMQLTQLGEVPMAIYILGRAHLAVEDGLSGFGLGLRGLRTGLIGALIAILVVLPLTVEVSMAIGKMLEYLHITPPELAHESLKQLVELPWGPRRWGLIACAVIGAPIFEELMFRGMVQTALVETGVIRNRWWVILIASVLFASIHLNVVPWFALPQIFVLSLGLGFVYERTGSLYAPMLLHMAFNGVQIYAALHMQTPAAP